MSERLIVCVDLDGVLNLFDGWRGADYFHPPRPGALKFLQSLRERNYSVIIHTTRWAPHVWEWIRLHGLEGCIDDVTDKKPPAHVFIDDRAICFRGNFEETLQGVDCFRAHWEADEAR